jgi:hypothetical protein
MESCRAYVDQPFTLCATQWVHESFLSALCAVESAPNWLRVGLFLSLLAYRKFGEFSAVTVYLVVEISEVES